MQANLGGVQAIAYRAFDLHLKARPRDWNRELRASYERQVGLMRQALKTRAAQRVAGTKPSLPLEQYAGTYADSTYGEAKVRTEDGRLVLSRHSGWVADLEHWHFDTFRPRWRAGAPPFVLGNDNPDFATFVIGASGKVDELKLETFAGPMTFKRAPEKADTIAAVKIADADLPRYTGTFESKSPPIALTVELVGGALKLSVPGQPAYTLVPVTPTRFKLTGAGVPAGFFLDYTIAGGAVKGVTLEQPAPAPTLRLTPARR
jgi:hypothetical protein